MDKIMVVWRRLGKEHGEGRGFKVNSQEVVFKHINDKLDAFSKTPDNSWRWWKINEKLIIETSDTSSDSGEPRMFYYLPDKNWLIVKNFDNEGCGADWKWYIHIGDTSFDKDFNCWIFTDWFADVIVKKDNSTHSVLDLDELGYAYKVGLINSDQFLQTLSSTQELVDTIRDGKFPPKEIEVY